MKINCISRRFPIATPSENTEPCLLESHLHTRNASQEPAAAAPLPETLSLGIHLRHRLCFPYQRHLDSLPTGNRQSRRRLTHGSHAAQTLVYAGLLLAIAVTKGIFQFLTRWVVFGISRDIEFDLRNDLFARLENLSSLVRPAPSHRRHNGARHQRPERSPDVARTSDHVFSEYAGLHGWSAPLS